MKNLFDDADPGETVEQLAPGAVLLSRFASSWEGELLETLNALVLRSPFRNLIAPGGFSMSVAMTSCGSLGWIADWKAYRNSSPSSG